MNEVVEVIAGVVAAVILGVATYAWFYVPHGDLPTSEELIPLALIGIGFAILAVRR